MNSSFFTLGTKDLIKGFILAIITAILTAVYQSVQNGALPADWASWKVILLSALGAGIGYALKNLLTNRNDEFLRKEQ